MGFLLFFAIAIVLRSVYATQPWNTANNWPQGSPWWHRYGAGIDISSSFTLPYPWNDPNYDAPGCFEAIIDVNGDGSVNNIPFNPQVECPLCKDLTSSTPGFAPDPNDCQCFYMCSENGNVWSASHMCCPDCLFWNQRKLTCEGVDNVCPIPSAPTGIPTHTPAPPKKLISCITFDNGVQGLDNNMWVKNHGVSIVSMVGGNSCPYNDCGFFDGSAFLEVPYFSNVWSAFNAFSVCLFIWRDSAFGAGLQGVISNDCSGLVPNIPANSMYVGSETGSVKTGLKSPSVDETIPSPNVPDDNWSHVVMSWDGVNMKVYLDGSLYSSQTFNGPISNSPEFCPLVVGKFIWDAVTTMFNGYMDEVCFFRDGLTNTNVLSIYNNPPSAYGM